MPQSASITLITPNSVAPPSTPAFALSSSAEIASRVNSYRAAAQRAPLSWPPRSRAPLA